MALIHDMSCLYTTVRNTSGGRKKFSFLPPHGKELAANEEYTVFGSITEAVIKMDRVTSKRHIEALERALDAHAGIADLTIIKTPSPVLEDNEGEPKILRVTSGGQLTLSDPCWTSSA